MLTASWQLFVITLLYAMLYLLTSYFQARVVYGDGAQEEHAATLDALEGVLRRQVTDIASDTLVDSAE